MDPQQRLLVECAYLAFVDAGYTKESLMGQNVGVYVGIWPLNEFSIWSKHDSSVYSINSKEQSTAAGRISFVFGLHGPCIAYNTACSSSLVDLHGAIQGIQTGDCDIAIVLGVNCFFGPASHLAGHCKSGNAFAHRPMSYI